MNVSRISVIGFALTVLVGCSKPPESEEVSDLAPEGKYRVDTESIRDLDSIEIQGDAELTYVDVRLVDGIGKAKGELLPMIAVPTLILVVRARIQAAGETASDPPASAVHTES